MGCPKALFSLVVVVHLDMSCARHKVRSTMSLRRATAVANASIRTEIPVAAQAVSAKHSTIETSLTQAGQARYVGVGRRKCAVSRVRLEPGGGAITFNDRDVDEYLQYNPAFIECA